MRRRRPSRRGWRCGDAQATRAARQGAPLKRKQYEARRHDPTSPRLAYRGVVASWLRVTYWPTVKSTRFTTVPAASRTSTCHAPVQSAGTVFRLQVRHGEPPTCSSTSPTCVSPWNHTWWIVVSAPAGAPLTLVQNTSWPTSTGNTEPVSCGTRSTTFFATAASSTLTLALAG